jgi:formylglycine-generating enzyme required for sulfatase activity
MSSTRSTILRVSHPAWRALAATVATLALTLSAHAQSNCVEDLDGDGEVGGGDLALVLLAWGPCPDTPPGAWYTVIDQLPDPAVVTDADTRTRIVASGHPWRVKDNATGIEMLLVPAGSFSMGQSPGDTQAYPDEIPAHPVALSSAVYLGRYEVTQEQWMSRAGRNPSYFKGPVTLPVESVSWEDAKAFCDAHGMRLPTEAEWEYACRAGTTTPRYGDLGDIAWYASNAGGTTHAVGGKLANPWGFHDMLGNVWEWTADRYGDYSVTAATDPKGATSGSYRVQRGCYWGYGIDTLRASNRGVYGPAGRFGNIGFRVARSADPLP